MQELSLVDIFVFKFFRDCLEFGETDFVDSFR